MRIKEAIDVHMVEYDSSEDNVKTRCIRIRALHHLELVELKLEEEVSRHAAKLKGELCDKCPYYFDPCGYYLRRED